MGPRPSSELIQSLRLTMQYLDERYASDADQPALAELKRILLLRVAEIEAFEATAEPAEERP